MRVYLADTVKDFEIKEWGNLGSLKVSAPSLHREDHHQTLEEMSVFLSVLLNALSSWASGQTVKRRSIFMLAGIETSKLIKSPLLVFHAALMLSCKHSTLKSWWDWFRLRDTLCGKAARSSQQPTPWVPRHREKLCCQHIPAASTKRRHKKMPQRKRLACTVKI